MTADCVPWENDNSQVDSMGGSVEEQKTFSCLQCGGVVGCECCENWPRGQAWHKLLYVVSNVAEYGRNNLQKLKARRKVWSLVAGWLNKSIYCKKSSSVKTAVLLNWTIYGSVNEVIALPHRSLPRCFSPCLKVDPPSRSCRSLDIRQVTWQKTVRGQMTKKRLYSMFTMANVFANKINKLTLNRLNVTISFM